MGRGDNDASVLAMQASVDGAAIGLHPTLFLPVIAMATALAETIMIYGPLIESERVWEARKTNGAQKQCRVAGRCKCKSWSPGTRSGH